MILSREASACTVGQEWVSVWRKMELLQRDMESMARGVSPASAAMACETWASAGEYHDNPLMRFCSRHRQQQEGDVVSSFQYGDFLYSLLTISL